MRRPPRVNRHPLRAVLEARWRVTIMGVGHTGLRTRYWALKLECGHEVERRVRYVKGASEGRQGWARLHHEPSAALMLPAPRRARCEMCTGP